MLSKFVRFGCAAGLLLAALNMPALALEKPSGPVILTVTGQVTEVNEGNAAAFDLEMLERLESRTTQTQTPWSEGTPSFEGPLLKAVLAAAGAHGDTLVVKALNDYAAELPIADATELATILAVRRDGEALSVRDKGPLFLMYPFDTNPELYNEKYFNRSVWQIREIEVSE